MNKNINTVVELTEKELACVTGGGIIVGGIIVGGEGGRIEKEKKPRPPYVLPRQ